jgi:hypothetical protein
MILKILYRVRDSWQDVAGVRKRKEEGGKKKAKVTRSTPV